GLQRDPDVLPALVRPGAARRPPRDARRPGGPASPGRSRRAHGTPRGAAARDGRRRPHARATRAPPHRPGHEPGACARRRHAGALGAAARAAAGPRATAPRGRDALPARAAREPSMTRRRSTYHHGDLPRALRAAALPPRAGATRAAPPAATRAAPRPAVSSPSTGRRDSRSAKRRLTWASATPRRIA